MQSKINVIDYVRSVGRLVHGCYMKQVLEYCGTPATMVVDSVSIVRDAIGLHDDKTHAKSARNVCLARTTIDPPA